MHTIEIREPWQQRFRRYWWLGIFPTISAYLGVWQVHPTKFLFLFATAYLLIYIQGSTTRMEERCIGEDQ